MLLGNSSVNTVKHTTTEEAVFAVTVVTSRSSEWWSCDMFSVMRVRSSAI
jgi:hypothetical protein